MILLGKKINLLSAHKTKPRYVLDIVVARQKNYDTNEILFLDFFYIILEWQYPYNTHIVYNIIIIKTKDFLPHTYR